MIPFRHPASLMRRTAPLQTALIAAAFWTLAVIALTELRYIHLGGLPQVLTIIARAAMLCCILLFGLVGAQCVMAWRKSGSLGPIRRMLGGPPGMLLFAAVASYLAIGASVLDAEAIQEPDTAGLLKYHILLLGVLAAAVVGGRAVLERTGADRLLKGMLAVLIASCAVILASPILRDLGILRPYWIPFRLTGTFDEPNSAGFVACMTVALAAGSLTNGGPRVLGLLGLVAGVAASLATASRTVLVVLGALAIVFLSINARSKPRTIVLAWAVIGLIGTAVLAGVAGFSGVVSSWWTLRTTPGAAYEVFCDSSRTDNPGPDCAVLLETKDALAGDMTLNWTRAAPVTYWQGVTTDGQEGRVTELHLAGLGLNGRIPSALGRLDRLVSLSLQRNRLTGRIPPELGDLASLEKLNLSYNALTGGIPPELATLENLDELRLRGNRLTGPVPAALRQQDLSVLRLSGNGFDSVPPALAAVAERDLANARFCLPPPSTTPALFDDCAVLLAVKDALAGDASLNWHTAVPVGSWQGVTVGRSSDRVVALNLQDMNLTGRLPAELSELSHLYMLRLNGNRLTGAIPAEFANLTRLTMLSLDGNRLTGPIPPALANLSNLRQLWLADNRLTGSIPPELSGNPDLSLAIAGNDFHGCLPWVLHRLARHDLDNALLCIVLGNDRLWLWRLGLEKALATPVLGHGFGAARYLDGAPAGYNGRPPDVHNLYLMLLIDAGFVPLLLFVSAIVLLLRAQRGATKSLARDATIAWVVVIALYSMTFQHLLGLAAFMFLAGVSVATGMAHDDCDRHVA